jgi:hypothetical protein
MGALGMTIWMAMQVMISSMATVYTYLLVLSFYKRYVDENGCNRGDF